MINRSLKQYIFKEQDANYELGKIFSQAIIKEVTKINVLPPAFYVMKKTLIAKYPQYYDEVLKRAQGAGVDYDKYLYFISFELREKACDKCSDIVIKQNNNILFGHNEDGQYTVNDTALVKYLTPNGSYLELASYDSLAGTTFIINSHGLILSVNYIYMQNQNVTDVSAWFVLRDLVNCHNLTEIIAKLNKAHCASGFNLNVINILNNKAYTIEFCLNKYIIYEITDKYIHTNHFLHFPDTFNPATQKSNTHNRFLKITELLNKYPISKIKINNIEKILAYTNPDYMKTIHIKRKYHQHYQTAICLLYDSKHQKLILNNYLGKRKKRLKIIKPF